MPPMDPYMAEPSQDRLWMHAVFIYIHVHSSLICRARVGQHQNMCLVIFFRPRCNEGSLAPSNPSWIRTVTRRIVKKMRCEEDRRIKKEKARSFELKRSPDYAVSASYLEINSITDRQVQEEFLSELLVQRNETKRQPPPYDA